MFRIIIATAVVLVFLAACGEAGGERPQPTPTEEATAAETPTATPTQSPGGAGGGDDGTVVPILTPFPSPEPVPADWATYTQAPSDKSDGFSFAHPADWLVQGGDPAGPAAGLTIAMWSWKEAEPPADALKIDLFIDPVGMPTCERSEGSAPATLGDVEGWQTIQIFDPLTSGGLRQSHRVVVDRTSFEYCVTAYFAHDVDETTFQRVLGSFSFTDE